MTSIPPHEIVVVPAFGQEGRDALKEQCFEVRIEVFHREQGFPLDTEIDDLDETATHFLLRLVPSQTPVGTIRATRAESGAYYKLSRFAVLKEYRTFKFGRELVLALHDWVLEDARRRGVSGSVKIVTHSQIPVKGLYARYGYQDEGDEFDEDGAPHQKMVKKVSLPA
ncbi:hypothetical protein PLICRDRAFT_199139 [Plicaturopsis crispa FD-325 SS-3]|nr:hypothetical protein PLICRDRAFT_199139 [Plicaturopsis crispa FD-325 SS-3]